VTLSFFVPGRLRNFANRGSKKYQTEWRYRTEWHQNTAAAYRIVRPPKGVMPSPETPKRITFDCRTWNTFDDDGLANAVKPIRDQLKKEGLINDDSPRSRHKFLYSQKISRPKMGCFVTVELLEGGK
jgi:hypothetical protein